jgi:hypothetical protein
MHTAIDLTEGLPGAALRRHFWHQLCTSRRGLQGVFSDSHGHNDIMKRTSRSSLFRPAAGACLALLCLAEMAAAHAWSLTITSGSRRLFLHVGNGALSGTSGTLNGTAGTSGAVNLVQVTVPVAQLGNGTDLAMTSNSTQSTSLYGDGNNTCPTPASQVMVGAGYRRNSGSANATLSVSSPANLTNAGGDTIPFTEISWTVSAPGSGVPNVIPAGTFNGGTQTLATVAGNTYLENCHTFSYANNAVRAAGTYNGRVTYTLSSP